MLDVFIIEELRKKQQEKRQERERPRLEVPYAEERDQSSDKQDKPEPSTVIQMQL